MNSLGKRVFVPKQGMTAEEVEKCNREDAIRIIREV